ncbi:galactitol-1-phosphate 5-dehydrogenase [Candidatus Margulisiibacteriota bacterium]
MKALTLIENGVLKYQDVPDPVVADDECLIAVKSCGICNSDIFRAYNKGAYFYPLIMGHEFSGLVKETGRTAQKFKPGDRVAVFPLLPCKTCEFCLKESYAQCTNYDYYGSRRDGAFAQYISIKEWNLLKIHDGLDYAAAALSEPVAVAIHAVRKMKLNKNDSVAVIGAGVIGLSCALFLSKKLDPAHIYIIDRNDPKLEVAGSFGINVINARQNSNWAEELIKKSGGGLTHVIEACGAVETFRDSLSIVRAHGNVLWVGNIHNDLNIPKSMVSSVLRKEVSIFGVWNSAYQHSPEDDWHYALDFIRSNDVIKELITDKVKLENGEAVFEAMYQRKTGSSGSARNNKANIKTMFVFE